MRIEHSSENKSTICRYASIWVISILCIYDPWFNSQIRGVIVSLFLLMLTHVLFFKRKYSVAHELKILIILIVFTAFSLIPAIYNNTFETGVFFMYLKMCIYFLICLVFAKQVSEGYILIKMISHGVIFQIIVILLCFVSVFIRDFIYSVHTVDERFYVSEQAYRLYFFTSSSFFQLSLFFGFLFHFMAALYNEKKVKLWVLLAIFICGMFSGRTFLIFSIITVLFYGLRFRFIPAYVMVSACLLAIAIELPDNVYVKHALEPIINLINSGTLDTNSSDKLVNDMLFIPDFRALIIGDGLYYNPNGSYYMLTDSGIIRQLLYGGFVYFLFCFGLMSYLIYIVSKKWFNAKWKFTLSAMLVLLIGNIKADVLMYPGLTLNLIFILLLVTKGKNDQNIYSISQRLTKKSCDI